MYQDFSVIIDQSLNMQSSQLHQMFVCKLQPSHPDVETYRYNNQNIW